MLAWRRVLPTVFNDRRIQDDDYELLPSDTSSSPYLNGHAPHTSSSYDSSYQPHRRRRTKLAKYCLHLCSIRRILICLATIPILVAIGILWSGIPPDYKDVREYERRLPQHNVSEARLRGDRYLRFPGHLWGHGLNNVLQEAILMSYLAYAANRSYVFEDYVWSHSPFPYTLYDFALRPVRIPLNAFVSGPTAGGRMPQNNQSTYIPASISAAFYQQVCPPDERRVISSKDAPSDAEGSMLIKWWVERLQGVLDRCVEIDSDEKVVFDRFLFGGPRILSILPGLSASPILSHFSWSPLVLSAVARNFAVLRPQSLDVLYSPPAIHSSSISSSSSGHISSFNESSSTSSESHTTISTSTSSSSSSSTSSGSGIHPPTFGGMLAVHIRRGDYKRHCPRLAQWHSSYMGIAQYPGLPDRFDPSPFDGNDSSSLPEDDTSKDHNISDEDPALNPRTREEYYIAHCLPSISQIVNRLSVVRSEYSSSTHSSRESKPQLSKVYILSNGWSFFLSSLSSALKADGWEDVISSFEVERNFDGEQKYVGMAVDMAIAERAEVFVGNGFSSLSANIILLRMARGMDVMTNRLL